MGNREDMAWSKNDGNNVIDLRADESAREGLVIRTIGSPLA